MHNLSGGKKRKILEISKVAKPRISLNFGNRKYKTLDADAIFDFHIGEQFQYNGVAYNITNIRHHFSEGFASYTELFLEEIEG